MKRSSWIFFFISLLCVSLFFFFWDKKVEIADSSLSSDQPVTSLNSMKEPSAAMSPSVETSSSTVAITMNPRQDRTPKSLGAELALLNLKDIKLESLPLLADTRWKLWPGVTASSKSAGSPQGRVLGEVNGYYLVESGAHADVRNYLSQQPIVVVDPRLEIAGVVTGVLSVVLKEGAPSSTLSGLSGVKTRDSFPEIRTYFVTSEEEPFDLQGLFEALKSDASVEQVQLEILSRRYEKH